jgi:tRNA splicing ligase
MDAATNICLLKNKSHIRIQASILMCFGDRCIITTHRLVKVLLDYTNSLGKSQVTADTNEMFLKYMSRYMFQFTYESLEGIPSTTA